MRWGRFCSNAGGTCSAGGLGVVCSATLTTSIPLIRIPCLEIMFLILSTLSWATAVHLSFVLSDHFFPHLFGSFGTDVNAAMCGGSGGSCAVCSVCRIGFELRLAGTGPAGGRVRPLRYGQGLYFSSTSSKSDDYAACSERSGPGGTRLRCMFLCKVASCSIVGMQAQR